MCIRDRINYDPTNLRNIFSGVKAVVDTYGLSAVPNELQPIEFRMNHLLLDRMEDAGPNNTVDQLNSFTFDGYNQEVQRRIEESFLVHTTVTGSLDINYDTVNVRSGKADPIYVTYKPVSYTHLTLPTTPYV